MTDWISLIEVWAESMEMARERDATHDYDGNLARTRIATHFLGVLGEQVWRLWSGGEKPRVLGGPDDGTDFLGKVDVKAIDYLGPTPLLLIPAGDELTAKYYPLAQIDMEHQRGRLLGWATAAEVAAVDITPAGKRGMKIDTRVLGLLALHSMATIPLPMGAG